MGRPWRVRAGADELMANPDKLVELASRMTDEEIGKLYSVTGRTVRMWRATLSISRTGRYRVERGVKVRDPLAPDDRGVIVYDQQSVLDERAYLAVCPTCRWTTTIHLVKYWAGRPWYPESDVKLSFEAGGRVVHRECQTTMRVLR